MKIVSISDPDGRVGAQYEVSDALAAALTDLTRRINRNFVEATTTGTHTSSPAGLASIGSFSWALERLKAGARVCRRGWNGKGMWLALVQDGDWGLNKPVQRFAPFTTNPRGVLTAPWVMMKTADDKLVPWLASQTDLLADDWEEVAEAATPNPRRDNPPELGREWA